MATAPLVQPYATARDHTGVVALWRETLGSRWPLTNEQLHLILPPEPRAGETWFVVRDEAQLLGFITAQARQAAPDAPPVGSIRILLVTPTARRRGIGTALHDHALTALRAQGVKAVGAGGGSPRLWPGIPSDLPEAMAFFAAHGWDLTEQSHDLIHDLRQGFGAADLPSLPSEIAITTAQADEVPAILAFEHREFPSWRAAYATLARHGRHDDIVIARRDDGAIVGTLIAFGPDSQPEPDNVIWTELLGADCGGLGAVGVAASARRQGIGAALVAYGTVLLRERGVGFGYIGWTWLPEFYEQHGYRLWQSYAMGRRTL